MNAGELIAELLPIAESLFVLIEKIKTDAPDAWAAVGDEYKQAEQAWRASRTPPTHADTVAVAAPPGTTEPVAIATSPEPHTLSTAEQTAAGLPPANYTKG